MRPEITPDGAHGSGIRCWRNGVGQFHRVNGPAVERPDGRKFWYRRDVQHREGGPACECNRGRCWFRNGRCTREQMYKEEDE